MHHITTIKIDGLWVYIKILNLKMVQKEGGQRNDHGALVGQVSQCIFIIMATQNIYVYGWGSLPLDNLQMI